MRIVIIGGGFAGLHAAKTLAPHGVEITIVDKSNHHLFQPLLYQVATAALSPSDIAHPIRRIFRRYKNVTVLMSEATGIVPSKKSVKLATAELEYDFLIVATGATHAYFGHPDWAHFAPGLKTLEDAIHIRGIFLSAFEEAELETDKVKQAELMTFIIVGAGPTGVELAGTMSEIAKRGIYKEFRNCNPRETRIILLEAGPRVLGTYPERLSLRAEKQLQRLGVIVRNNAAVTRIEEHAVYIGDEKIIAGRILWAAGVAASPLVQMLKDVPLDKSGRVQVNPDLSVPGYPEIMIAGDLANIRDAAGKIVPGVAPAAIQMGKYCGRRILKLMEGKSVSPFIYKDKGSLATIGKAAAVAQIGNLQFSGFIAWLMWLFVHILFLIGFRNKLFVLLEWAWAYLGFQLNARLITYYDAGKIPEKL